MQQTSVPRVNVQAADAGGGWLGGLWNMGSAAMKTAEQKVKELQQTEEAKAWEERVRGNVSVLGKLGTTRFDDVNGRYRLAVSYYAVPVVHAYYCFEYDCTTY
jgi:hypothetical protein